MFVVQHEQFEVPPKKSYLATVKKATDEPSTGFPGEVHGSKHQHSRNDIRNDESQHNETGHDCGSPQIFARRSIVHLERCFHDVCRHTQQRNYDSHCFSLETACYSAMTVTRQFFKNIKNSLTPVNRLGVA